MLHCILDFRCMTAFTFMSYFCSSDNLLLPGTRNLPLERCSIACCYHKTFSSTCSGSEAVQSLIVPSDELQVVLVAAVLHLADSLRTRLSRRCSTCSPGDRARRSRLLSRWQCLRIRIRNRPPIRFGRLIRIRIWSVLIRLIRICRPARWELFGS